MTINETHLAVLVCPETHQKVSLADADLVERCNCAIRNRKLRNRAGRDIQETIDGLLIREDQKMGYPVVDDIPHMLIDEAIIVFEIPSAA
jgi:uncharacterized protein YbaR (Trm112 family)